MLADIPWLLAVLFLLYAATATTLGAILMPPFQAADELAHAQRADEIAAGELVASRGSDRNTAGGLVHAGLGQLAAPFDPIRFHPKRKVDEARMLAADAVPWGRIEWQPFPNTAIYPPFFYLPATAGLLAGRLLHLSVWHAVILSRMVTAISCILVAGTAIGLAEAFAPLLFALLCLPMTLGLFAAISQDGLMIACAALAAVLLAAPRGTIWRVLLGCALVAMVAMARPVYLPLCLCPLLWIRQAWIGRVAGAGLAAGAAMGWVAITSRLVMPAAFSEHVTRQIAAIRQHPFILRLVVHTTVHNQLVNGLPVGREFIGVLGWLDTTLPNPYYALAGIMLLVAASVSRRPQTASSAIPTVLALLMIAAAVGAVYAAQYLSYSQIGGATLEGVQGRYFLPIAPFLVFALPQCSRQPNPPTVPRPVLIAIALFPVLSIALAARAILVRYYLG